MIAVWTPLTTPCSAKHSVLSFLQQNQNPGISKADVLDGMIEQKVLVYFARQDSTLVVDDIQLNTMVKEQLDTYKQQFGGSVESLENYFDKS